MKALSVRQPWAFWIASGQKAIENRDWATQHRGPLLIHASSGGPRYEYDQALESLDAWFDEAAAQRLRSMVPPYAEIERGGIVAVATLVKVTASPTHLEHLLAWEAPGGYAWHLANIREVPFRTCRGMPGIWDVDATLLEIFVDEGAFDG